MLYTAKGTAAFLVPLGNVVKSATGSWTMVFVITAVMNSSPRSWRRLVLKPLRMQEMAKG